jgi:hypothetical protein
MKERSGENKISKKNKLLVLLTIIKYIEDKLEKDSIIY